MHDSKGCSVKFATQSGMGAFFDATRVGDPVEGRERIFEEFGKGMLATL